MWECENNVRNALWLWQSDLQEAVNINNMLQFLFEIALNYWQTAGKVCFGKTPMELKILHNCDVLKLMYYIQKNTFLQTL